MPDPIIRVENIGKKYRLRHQQQRGPRYQSLRDVLTDGTSRLAKRLSRPFAPRSNGKLSEEFWAVRDVSFDVEQGEVVGIIGRNGAGKSTLLKILSRITEPTTGRITLDGRVASLLEVGTGFHPELTGRENIYLNGAVLGMSRLETRSKFDEIVAFAEVAKFLDTPVKHYSSGMYMRLAFAVAAHLEPEILIVDEVLAVGDAEFQRKCLGKMSEVSRQGRTVLFVSHNMTTVSRLCSRTIWMADGAVAMNDLTTAVIPAYMASGSIETGELAWAEGISNQGISDFKVSAVRLLCAAGVPASTFQNSEPFYLEIDYDIRQQLPYCRVGFNISTMDGTLIFESYDADHESNAGRRTPGVYRSRCEVPANLLCPGTYFISINVGIVNVRNLVSLENLLRVQIEDTSREGSFLSRHRRGVIRPLLHWEGNRL